MDLSVSLGRDSQRVPVMQGSEPKGSLYTKGGAVGEKTDLTCHSAYLGKDLPGGGGSGRGQVILPGGLGGNFQPRTGRLGEG